MYERFYGLRERPFDLTPNPKYLCLSPRHSEALSNLRYGISARRGVTVLIGEAGTGKTTLVRAALASKELAMSQCVYLNNPALTRSEFIEFLARAFGLSERAATSKTALLLELEQLLVERSSRGIVSALLVDEAQALPLELLEEVRLLANIETATEKLLPVVLAGQPQLAVKLNDPELKQLKQRVALRCELLPLDHAETTAYVGGRIRIAGGDVKKVFAREAVELIHQCSRGIPRTISVICDNALVSGFAGDERPIGWETVFDVCSDFDLDPQKRQPRSNPPPAATLQSESKPERAVESGNASRSLAIPEARGLFSSFTRRRGFSFF
jgi:general secretion pathway protein A